jgi:hypothetical protein
MGIFDGVTGGQGGLTNDATAYEQNMRRVDAERQKYEYELEKAKYNQAMNMAQGSMLGQQQYASHQGLGGMRPKQQQAVPRFNPNESEAFQIPMSQLVTMWRLKHGDEWVDMQRARPPSGKDFYTDALDRLDRAGKLEMFDGWCRLEEDA